MMLYALSNTKATSDVQFMKKLSNTEATFKKRVAYKECSAILLLKKMNNIVNHFWERRKNEAIKKLMA